MGLDIMVYKICHKREAKDKDLYINLFDEETLEYENNFPEWTKEFEETITENFYDWDKYKELTGIDIEKYDVESMCYDSKGDFMYLIPKGVKLPNYEDFNYDYDAYKAAREKIIVTVDLDTVPTYDKDVKVLYYNRVGYQRKGLNDKFYDDYTDGKIGYYVWTLAELERYKCDYCDESWELEGGTKYYPKDKFQENIINEFEEGKCVVCFNW